MTSRSPTKRRRWFQFSLRTLMLLTVVLAVGAWLLVLALQERQWHRFGTTLVLENQATHEAFLQNAIATPEFREAFYAVLEEHEVEFVGESDQLSFRATADEPDLLFFFDYPVYDQDPYLDYGPLFEEALRRYSQQTGTPLPFKKLTFKERGGGEHASSPPTQH